MVWRTIHPGGLLFSLIRFVMVSAVLLIPTMLMGATLPIIVSAVRQFGDLRAVTISRLYGLNLLGVSSFLQQLVIGLVIVVAVLVDTLLKENKS